MQEIFGDSPTAEEVARWDAEADAWAKQLGYSARTFDDDAEPEAQNITVLTAPRLVPDDDGQEDDYEAGGGSITLAEWNDDPGGDSAGVVTTSKAAPKRGASAVRLGAPATAARSCPWWRG